MNLHRRELKTLKSMRVSGEPLGLRRLPTYAEPAAESFTRSRRTSSGSTGLVRW
jgi:hypothetical protein